MARIKKEVEAKPIEDQPVVAEEAVAQAVETENPAILDILRVFNQYAELYITSKGGVFPKDVPAYLVKDAVLYKNPYFNK